MERGEFELSGDFVKPFSKPLLLLVADEKLTGGQPLQRESQAQVIEHQALEFAGQELAFGASGTRVTIPIVSFGCQPCVAHASCGTRNDDFGGLP